MKNILLPFLLSAFISIKTDSAFSQSEWRVGVKLLPQMANITEKEEFDKSRFALGGGVLVTRKFNEAIGLQLGLLYKDRGFSQEYMEFYTSYTNVAIQNHYLKYKYAFISLPLLLKVYRGDFYCVVGPSINSLVKLSIKDDGENIRTVTNVDKRISYGGQLGIGYERKIFERYSVFLEANYDFMKSHISSITFMNYGLGIGAAFLF